MTLAALSRLRALPTIALALILAVALAGCSASEPADKTAAPAPAEEPATPEAPVEEEAEEPEPEAPAIDKTQLVTTVTEYFDGMDEPVVSKATYGDDGRILTYGNGTEERAWTYDNEGRILTERVIAESEMAPQDRLTTYTYGADGALAETLVEDHAPAVYINAETGEMGTDPALGELMQEAGESSRTQWTFSEDGKEKKGETFTLDGAPVESAIYYYDEDARTAYDTFSTDPRFLGQITPSAHPIRTESFDAEGNKIGESSITYDANGNRTSTKDVSNGATYELTSTYDEEGNQTSSTYSEDGINMSSETTWTYDEAGRPISSKTTYSENPDPQMEFFTYDSKGRLKATVYLAPMMGYDEDGNPTTEETMVSCTVYDYLVDNEELSATPQQLMDEARAQAA